MSTFVLESQSRTVEGKGASRRLRRLNNKIPAVVYGNGKSVNMVEVDHDHIFHALERGEIVAKIFDLAIDGKIESVILKDLQRHPYKRQILHADFIRVNAKEAITVSLPIKHVGECSAVKEGGVLSTVMDEIEVSALADALPEYIEVDISALEIGHAIHLQDVSAPKGCQFVALNSDSNPTLVTLSAPKTAADSAADSDAEGEEKTDE